LGRRINWDEYNRLENEARSCERYSVQGPTRRGLVHRHPPRPSKPSYPFRNKETKKNLRETNIKSKLVEISTIQQFDFYASSSAGFIIITDNANGNKFHRTECKRIRRENFKKKVVVNNCQNGHYYWVDVASLAKDLNAMPCSFCKPDE